MQKSKINKYEMSVILRYLPETFFDIEKMASGNYNIFECIKESTGTFNQLKELKELSSGSLLDIEIIAKALSSPAFIKTITHPLILLNCINERKDISESVLNSIIKQIESSHSYKNSAMSGVFRGTIESHLDKMSEENLRFSFSICNKMSKNFTNPVGFFSKDSLSPENDSLRKIEYEDDLRHIVTNNQALVALIKRSFSGGIRSLYKGESDMDMDMDKLLNLLEEESPFDKLAVEDLIDPEAFVANGQHAFSLSSLAKDIANIHSKGCTLKLTEADTALISDILLIFSQAIRIETDAQRKSFLSNAVISLLDMCHMPILNKNDGNESIFKLTVSWITSELFHDLSSNSKFTYSGEEKVDEAISAYFHAILLNIATAEKDILDKYRFSAMGICGNAIASRCEDVLVKKGSLDYIKKKERLILLDSIENKEIKSKILYNNPSLKRSSLNSDLGL